MPYTFFYDSYNDSYNAINNDDNVNDTGFRYLSEKNLEEQNYIKFGEPFSCYDKDQILCRQMNVTHSGLDCAIQVTWKMPVAPSAKIKVVEKTSYGDPIVVAYTPDAPFDNGFSTPKKYLEAALKALYDCNTRELREPCSSNHWDESCYGKPYSCEGAGTLSGFKVTVPNFDHTINYSFKDSTCRIEDGKTWYSMQVIGVGGRCAINGIPLVLGEVIGKEMDEDYRAFTSRICKYQAPSLLNENQNLGFFEQLSKLSTWEQVLIWGVSALGSLCILYCICKKASRNHEEHHDGEAMQVGPDFVVLPVVMQMHQMPHEPLQQVAFAA